MRKEIKKLYKGNVEVRDYDVQECIDKNQTFTIIHDGDAMTLSSEELITKRVGISKTFESKIAGAKSYKLYGYEWNPDEVEL